MFSGIIEAKERVLNYTPGDQVSRVQIKKPKNFQDLKSGDSIAVNGVCLTLESFDDESMFFCLGPETLKLTGWNKESLLNSTVNLERSLRYGDRVHGHFVLGHAEAMARVLKSEALGDSWVLEVEVPNTLSKYFWKKSSVALNGVSLTINQVGSDRIEVTLIPETLKRTNLAELKVGDLITLEIDMMTKSLISNFEETQTHKGGPL